MLFPFGAVKIILSLNFNLFCLTNFFQAAYTNLSSIFLEEVKIGDLKTPPVPTSMR
jgi:hypothetical protein